jgi:dienelactone hydrolase
MKYDTERDRGHEPTNTLGARRAIASVLVLALSFAACSDPDKAADSPSTDETSATSSTTIEPALDGDLEAWCFSWLDNSGISDENGTEAALRAMLARVEAEAAVAPSAVAEQMNAHLEATRYFVEAMETAGWDEANLTPEDLDVLAPDPDLDRAIDELDAYAAENCDPSTAPGTPIPILDLPSPTTTAPTADPLELTETNRFDPLVPGAYVSDLLPFELDVTTTAEFDVTQAFPGNIVFEAVDPVGDFNGVGLFVVDTLVVSDVRGRHRERLPATTDLSPALEGRDGFTVVSTRQDELGGRPAQVWRVAWPEPCDGCEFESMLSITGWANEWGALPGYTQELWTIDAPGAPIVMSIEAPDDYFEAWLDHVDAHLLAGLQFREPTGYSLERPSGPSAGPHAVGRLEIAVTDTSRPTREVERDGDVIVPESGERELLLSVAFPSDDGGFGAPPAGGAFPLVVVAPALRDAGLALPADRLLASQGYVVVTIRFPETSRPASAVSGVPSQPADVSFVIDEVLAGALGPEITAAVDPERIGLVGHSAGATTAFGLLGFECCQDDRLDAIVAHAGTPYDFDSTRVPSTTPVLHVVSAGDQVAPADAVRTFHEATDGPSALAVLQHDSHIAWLAPDAVHYNDANQLVQAFLDRHLRAMDVDLASIATDSAFIELDERP